MWEENKHKKLLYKCVDCVTLCAKGKYMSNRTHRVNVSFTDDEFQILDFWSKKKGQSLASLVRFLAKDGIDECEEARLAKIVAERQKGPFISHEEMWAPLNT